MLACALLQVLGGTCVVSTALISGAKQHAEELAKQEADRTLHARRSSAGGGAAGASSNGSSDAAAGGAGAASGGRNPTTASPAKQRVSESGGSIAVSCWACFDWLGLVTRHSFWACLEQCGKAVCVCG